MLKAVNNWIPGMGTITSTGTDNKALNVTTRLAVGALGAHAGMCACSTAKTMWTQGKSATGKEITTNSLTFTMQAAASVLALRAAVSK